jgi:DNA-binding NarL/FixJ family response regulator
MFAQGTLGIAHLWVGTWQDGRAALVAAMQRDPHRQLGHGMFSGILAWLKGRPDEAFSGVEQHLADSRLKHDFQGVVGAHFQTADFALQVDQVARAEADARTGFDLARTRYPFWLGLVAGVLAEALARQDAPDAAATISMLEQLVDERQAGVARPQLLRARAICLEREGNFEGALDALQSSAAIARSQHAVIALGQTLALLATVAASCGKPVLAAQARTELTAIVDGIGPEVRGLPWAQVVKHAPRAAALSPREREVAALVVRGLSNRQIADELVISERTVEHHVSNMLSRLGLDSRGQLAVWVVQQQQQ